MQKLGDLIDTLAALDPGLPLSHGYGFCSWRGSYKDVSLYSGITSLVTNTAEVQVGWLSLDEATRWDNHKPARTVGELLAIARLVADGGRLSGYKGGVYTMSPSSNLWGDEWGECPGNRVKGISVVKGKVFIARFKVD